MPAKLALVFADNFYDKMAKRKPPTMVSGLEGCMDRLFSTRSVGFYMVFGTCQTVKTIGIIGNRFKLTEEWFTGWVCKLPIREYRFRIDMLPIWIKILRIIWHAIELAFFHEGDHFLIASQ